MTFHLVRIFCAAGLVLACALFLGASANQTTPPSPLVLVFVVDGLRPDSINAEHSPTIHRLRTEGVEYLNSHSVFPTLTRVNAASLATGAYPALHGIVSNSMFHAAVNSTAAFDTGDYRNLLKLEEADGRAATFETLGEVLHRHGRKLVAVGSGSTGSAYLLNPAARRGVGALIHAHFDTGRVAAYPSEINDAVLKRFGAPDAKADDAAVMAWNDRVIRDYVLPELRPDVLVNWLGPLDAAQHEFGVGSPQALAALHGIDQSIDSTLNAVRTSGRVQQTTVFVVSDHGFARTGRGVDLTSELINAGLKNAESSTDVIVANQGFMASFYVAGREPRRIRQLVEFLQKQDWVNVIFTSSGKGGYGAVPGTFSLDLIKGSHPTRSPDVVVSSSWDSEPNSFGVKGTHSSMFPRPAGVSASDRSGHGGIAPWVVRNTLIASGARVKKAMKIESPAALPDIAPTVLTLFDIDAPSGSGRGRILRELVEGGPRPSRPTRRVISAESGSYRALIRLSSVAGYDYVDEGTRNR